MNKFSDRVMAFNAALEYTGKPLPKGIRVMNPFREKPQVMAIAGEFYSKYYGDNAKRFLILGINPGRHGGGMTGIPFTDPKRLVSVCNIGYEGPVTQEPSSAFIYEMIAAYGGPADFYHDFYFNSVCPLGFTNINPKGKEINYNYYDSADLTSSVEAYIISNIHKQLSLGVHPEVCICLGTGKNEKYLKKINEEHGFFRQVIAVEHPRYIMQYKSKTKDQYIAKYLKVFEEVKKMREKLK